MADEMLHLFLHWLQMFNGGLINHLFYIFLTIYKHNQVNSYTKMVCVLLGSNQLGKMYILYKIKIWR